MGQTGDLAERVFEIFEHGDLADIADVVAWNCELHMPGLTVAGPKQIAQLLGGYRTAFPDMHHEVLSRVESGNRFAWELRITGTHTGPMVTPAGTIAPTGKSVVWESVDVIESADGKIASWHAYFDQVSVMAQLGVLPEPASA